MKINKDWLDQLPPFVSVARVAELFDQAPLTVRRWIKSPKHPLTAVQLDNNQYVCPREGVVIMANALYGELENGSDSTGSTDCVHDSPGCGTRDGVDRPGDLRSAP